MGISFNGNGGNDLWQLYAKDPNIRSAAEQKFGVRKPEETQGVPTTAGFQANAGQFDWRSLEKFNMALNGNAGAPSVGGMKPSSSSPFQVAGTKTVNPATQVAPGEDKGLQQKLAGIGSGELTPTVGADNNNWMKDYYA